MSWWRVGAEETASKRGQDKIRQKREKERETERDGEMLTRGAHLSGRITSSCCRLRH